MAARGLDITGHRSRRITPDLLAGPDLIVGMAREHVREAVVLRPELYARTFTLKELVRRGSEVGRPARREPIDDWLRVPTRAAARPTAHGIVARRRRRRPGRSGPAVYERPPTSSTT